MDQDPAKDEEVEVGSTVTLTVSSGPDVVLVPNVMLQTQAEAVRLIEEAGLVAKVTPREVADAEPGLVLEQNPGADEEVPPGSTVEIFVSTEVGTVIVPDVIGTPLAQAQAQIQAAGLRFAEATETPSATVPAGAVISTDPGSGASVPTNSVVQIVVSSGPEQVDVPNLVGRTEADATAELRNRGLESDVTPQSVPAGDPNAGRVISQQPNGGTRVDVGSTVGITVGVASAATTTTTTSSSTTTTSQP
jgi:serine/threonine-protein kinase